MRRLVVTAVVLVTVGCGSGEAPPPPSLFDLTVTVTGTGAGSVSSSAGQLNCAAASGRTSGTCAIRLEEGTSVSLTATAAAGSGFAGWTDACSSAATAASCTLTVASDVTIGASFDLVPVVFDTAGLPRGRVGVPYSATLRASGGLGSYQWAITSGTLPPGLVLDAASGIIAGTPSVQGTTTFTVRVASGGAAAERAQSVVIDPAALTVTTAALPDGEQGRSYAYTLQAVGGTPPYGWSIAAGSLPAGLTLSASTGAIGGVPTASGSVQFTVRVTAGSETADAALTLMVAPPPVTISTTSLPNGRVGQAYAQQLQASGGTGSFAWAVASGQLPAGLQLGSSGSLAGTPTSFGSTTFTVRASSGGRLAEQTLTLAVDPPPPSIVTAALRSGVVGVPYADTLRASGGNGSYAWSLTGGVLPAGITLAPSTGVLSGTPLASGTSSIAVQVLSAGQSAGANLSLAIIDPPSIVDVNCLGSTSGFAGNYPECVPVFQVTQPGGQPAAGATVSFAAIGGGSLARASGTADANGYVAAPGWRLGGTLGMQRLQARTGPSTAEAVATVSAVPASQYQVLVRFTGSTPTPAQQQAFQSAAQRWSQIIVGDMPDAFASVAASSDGCHPALNETIDDVVIYARIAPIDGVGGILGQAGPRLVRSGVPWPVLGCMTFDDADLAALEANGTLGPVILHEMGHVLGIGTIWNAQGLLSGAGGTNPYFLGVAAAVAYLGARPGATPWPGLLEAVPVENTGNPGTRDAHWRESVFSIELMTGWIGPGTVTPLSAITAASLRDQGYVVNDAASAPFTLASALRAATGPLFELRESPPTEPIGVLGPDGRVDRYVRPGEPLMQRLQSGRMDVLRQR